MKPVDLKIERFGVTSPLWVDNPEAMTGGGDERHQPAQRVERMRQLRDDPLGWMHTHHRLDDAQLLAGRRWQGLWVRASANIQAMDTSKEPVDGGGNGAEVAIGPLVALQRLRIAARVMVEAAPSEERGKERVRLVQHIVGYELFPQYVAALKGISGERPVRRLVKEFRQALDSLARSSAWH